MIFGIEKKGGGEQKKYISTRTIWMVQRLLLVISMVEMVLKELTAHKQKRKYTVLYTRPRPAKFIFNRYS